MGASLQKAVLTSFKKSKSQNWKNNDREGRFIERKLTIGSLFSGIGGIELGLEWTGGFETRWQCEINDYARRVLAKHWPGIPIFQDVKEIFETEFPEKVDVICGGFPCQPFSTAGKRKGEQDERHLWPEFIRIIREVRPRWVIAENVPGLLTIDSGGPFGRILWSLASCGYSFEWDTISAASVGALHPRNRIIIVAHANGDGEGKLPGTIPEKEGIFRRRSEGDLSPRCGEVLADPMRLGLEGQRSELEATGAFRKGQMANPSSEGVRGLPIQQRRPQQADPNIVRGGQDVENSISDRREQRDRFDGQIYFDGKYGEAIRRESPDNSGCSGPGRVFARRPESRGCWEVEPDMGRVAHGVPDRVDRLGRLGNAVVPQVAQYIGELIIEYEQRARH